MNVLSLFDGMSCGQIALNRASIKYDLYLASEIDKAAIKVTQTNYPSTIQLGDVTKIEGWEIPKIDLLMGGSPCQGFSFAGKGLNFEDPRSRLFFEFVRLKNEIRPKYFLLENVVMKKQHQKVISEFLGVEPIMINSSLVSAQNRKRLYWTNINVRGLPENKGLLLRDVIDEKSQIIDFTERLKSKRAGTLAYSKGWNNVRGLHEKSKALLTGGHSVSNTGSTNLEYEKGRYRKLSPVECERLQTVPDNYTRCVSDAQRYRMLGNGWTVDVIVHILKQVF